MDLTEKMTLRYEVTFSTSTDAEAKEAGESVKTTTTIVYKDWTLQDFMEAAASRVVINQMQPRIRRGETIGAEWEASKPGTKLGGAKEVSPSRALKMMCGDKTDKIIKAFGSADKAIMAIKASLLDDMLKNMLEKDETE